MQDDELRNLVDEYLYLVEVGSGSTRADESELAHLLDRLALAVRHGVDPGDPDPVPEVPARDREVLRKVAASRFPAFGSYERPAATPLGARREGESVSAVDDVATVADHLHAVAWLWRNHDRDAGLWYLHDSYRRHWGYALRGLQLYVFLRERAREEREAARVDPLSSEADPKPEPS